MGVDVLAPRVLRRYLARHVVGVGFSFQDDVPKVIQVEIESYLKRFRDAVEDFASDEALAKHVLDLSKKNDPAGLFALNTKDSKFGYKFWQMRDWFFDLQKIVPFLVLELVKYNPKNVNELAKASKFWAKPWKWSPKGMNPEEDKAKKYLSVLKELRVQLHHCQEAAHSLAGAARKEGIPVGNFALYDALGLDESILKTSVDVLTKAAHAMTGIGLGGFCYGKVTMVDSSKFASRSAAFYVKNTDEIFLSPNLQENDVRAMCHEIAHRVHTKLNLRQRADELYRTVDERGTWVTAYAKTDAEENFCEMVSFAAIKNLSDDMKDLLKTCTDKLKL